MKKKRKIPILPYFLLLIPLILVTIFSFYPFIKTVVSSFSHTTEVGSWISWAGLENWEMVLTDGAFWQVIRNTFVFAALVLVISFAGSMLFALFADGCKRKGRRLVQTLYALPLVIASAPTSIIWKFILRKEGGILNLLLGTDIAWLLDSRTALGAVAVVTAWSQIAGSFILLLAGFRNVSEELLEAATLDGAGSFTKALKIKIPIASPQIFYVIFLKIITAFKAFGQIRLLTAGGPVGSSTTLMYKVYERGTASGYFELACCYSVILFIIIFTATRIQFLMEKKFVHYQ
mgnify:CR=1 FL=1